MGLSLPEKVAVFCRELGDNALLDLARQTPDMEEVFTRARDSLREDRIDGALEADLDALDKMVRAAVGEGLYPGAVRGLPDLPGVSGSSGAQWWACPSWRCTGRGRVVPGRQPPVCAATGQPLEPGPLRG